MSSAEMSSASPPRMRAPSTHRLGWHTVPREPVYDTNRTRPRTTFTPRLSRSTSLTRAVLRARISSRVTKMPVPRARRSSNPLVPARV